ncbi:hypothetical protein [Veillonella seminalis]|uniref:Uncharacterized protein n=1 Tax=Veillonella seminalis TaxID=1502943 RepID=A0A833CBJ6_9FIRM|nr:hypothetical protein [Veillonella seminalis]KAB1479037.1 hypothetical protein F8R14_04895 [Veillonella seminalis]
MAEKRVKVKLIFGIGFNSKNKKRERKNKKHERKNKKHERKNKKVFLNHKMVLIRLHIFLEMQIE